MRRTTLLLALGAVLLVLASGTAFAVLTTATGGPVQRVEIKRETDESFASGTSWGLIQGSQVQVSIPSGTNRLIMARFSAQSACFPVPPGSGTGIDSWCSVRIVARNNAGVMTELAPAAGTNMRFDSTDRGTETVTSAESHSMDRSARLGQGTWTISAEKRTTSSNVGLLLDNWSFTVEQSQ